MPIATNPSTGEIRFLDETGTWQPAKTAVNPATREMMAFNGKDWQPVPASKGVFNYVDDAVRSIASGITFGWADEFSAKMDELTGRGGTYDENLKREHARDAQIPVEIKIPGEVAGAVGATVLTMPLAGVRALAAASSKLPQWFRFAALGAGEGALAGAGGAEEGSRGTGAAQGAAIGGAIGSVAPTVIRSGERTVNAVRGAFSPSSGAAADIGRALVRDQTTPSDIVARVTSAQIDRPGVATVADVGGENVRGLVERVAQSPGAGRTKVIPALTERQAGQLGRISEDLSSLTGTHQTAHKATEEVIAAQASAATPLYQAAYEAGDRIVWTPGLERLSSSPTVRDAMSGATRVWRDNAIADGYGAMNPGAMVSRGGNLEFLNGKVPVFPNVQFWDYTKRIIDDQVGAAIRAGEGRKARTLTRLAQVLRSEIDNVVPEYRTAREAWAGPSAYLNAIEDGRSILNKSISAEEFSASFRALSSSEKDGYRIGAVSSIISKMGNDPAKMVDLTKYLRSPEARAKIATIMPDDNAAQAWLRRLDFEVQSSELTGRSLGNSATARRQAEIADAKGIVGDLVIDTLTTAPSGISVLRRAITAGPRWLRDTIRSRTDAELADILTNPNRVKDLPSVIRRASQMPRAINSGTPRGTASTISGGVVTAE